jgi:demethylmenaquinone methyltransferase/2-methoxy-6-polyprenyl-1,4-benzoquinol methylase
MLARARQKVLRAGLAQPVRFLCADGASLPLRCCCVDAVFVSFTLELFDTPEIPVVLAECRRVLWPSGRICLVSLAKNSGSRVMLSLYDWAHAALPAWFDCRPILPVSALHGSGFHIRETIQGSMWGLPVQTVLAAVQKR